MKSIIPYEEDSSHTSYPSEMALNIGLNTLLDNM